MSAASTTSNLNPNKIAVIIPTYNAEDGIERAIRSAIEQDLPDGISLDVVVVDDCSTDATLARVAALRETFGETLIFAQQAKNAGPSAARNRALTLTDAAWFTPLDSDDFMSPGRLSSLYKTALSGPWDVVADNLIVSFDDAPETPIRTLWPSKPPGVVELTLARFVRQNLSTAGSRSELGYIKPLIDRRVLATADHYRGEMRFGEDYDLYTRLLVAGARFCLVDPLGYHAVQRQNSLSRSQKAADFERLVQSDTSLLARGDLTMADKKPVRRHLKETQAEWVWLRAIEAVKARNVAAFLGCFFVTPGATLSLIGKLLEQVIVRSRRKVGQGPA